MQNPELIDIGAFAGPRGLQGEVRVRTHQAKPDWLDEIKQKNITTLELHIEENTQTLTIQKATWFKAHLVIMRFAELPDRTAVETLQKEAKGGKGVFFMERACLPEPNRSDTFNTSDLEGLNVIDAESKTTLGKVLAVLSQGGQDFLEIQVANGNTTEVIPFSDHFFPTVDLTAKTIFARGLAGFFSTS